MINLPIFHPFYDQPADHIRFDFNPEVTEITIQSDGTADCLAKAKVEHWAKVFGLERQCQAHLPNLKRYNPRS